MSDVINSIFGRSKNETPGEYGVTSSLDQPATPASTPETVDTPAIEAEPVAPADSAAETEEVAASTTDEDEAAEAAPAEDVVAEPDETEPEDDDAEDGDDEDDTDDAEPEDDEAVEEETTDEDSDEATEDEDEAITEEAESDDAPGAVASEVAEETGETDETDVEPDTAEARPAAGVRGSTTVGDEVVAQLVTMLTRRTEGVHDLGTEGVSAGLDGDVATIKVSLVVEFGHAVKGLAERIRVSVIEAVEEFLGLDVAVVDVHVAGIHLPDAS
ncbi:Asp23/Gls24 family envelope stress response protein [Amycolatopsis sp. NPDC058986]|uniref:Asp23/Gls24 family envelope stress response protein n=1 Tax=unclassified Amycolatopsis TaxID=2618356 RepID=UPI003672E049